MQNEQEIITFDSYISFVEYVKEHNCFPVDVNKLNSRDLEIVLNLLQNENVFNFFKEARHMDIRRLKAIIEYDNAREEMKKATMLLKKSEQYVKKN